MLKTLRDCPWEWAKNVQIGEWCWLRAWLSITSPWQDVSVSLQTAKLKSQKWYLFRIELNREFEKTSPQHLSSIEKTSPQHLSQKYSKVLFLSRNHYPEAFVSCIDLTFSGCYHHRHPSMTPPDRWQRMHAMKPHPLKCWSRAIGMCLGGSSVHESDVKW